MSSENQQSSVADLLDRGSDRSSPSLENRVAYQWESRGDVLGHRHGTIRDETILGFIQDNVPATGAAAVLDIGCGYGNHLFMLNSRFGKRREVRLVGVNLDMNQLAYAKKFSHGVSGYENCEFEVADLSKGLPYADATFDVIAMSDVLEHMVDPDAAMRELFRVGKPGAAIVISTPLKGSLFKSAASLANAVTGGRIFKQYYRGKNTELGADGKPVMQVHAGNDHVSEMTYRELNRLFERAGLRVERVKLMQVMSGSRWFDRHPFLLSGLLFVEAVHGVLRRPSWAHSASFLLRKPNR